jgi:hypothetical protein
MSFSLTSGIWQSSEYKFRGSPVWTQSQPAGIECLKECARRLPEDAVAVVIGVYGGADLLAMVEANPKLRLFGVDPWEHLVRVNGDGMADKEARRHLIVCRHVLERLLFEHDLHQVRLLRGHSSETVAIWRDEIDLLYVDGDHSHEAVWQDLCNWGRRMRQDGNGGVMLGDDWHWPSVQKAVEDYASMEGLKLSHPTEQMWRLDR